MQKRKTLNLKEIIGIPLLKLENFFHFGLKRGYILLGTQVSLKIKRSCYIVLVSVQTLFTSFLINITKNLIEIHIQPFRCP